MLLIELARYVACPLCGEVHGLRIHAVPWRNVRSPEVGENIEVTVISIICGRAKEAGGQYSKRILPPFLIPYCQIGRQGVLAYLGQFPDGKIVYRFGNELLGARDIRTIRRHVALAESDRPIDFQAAVAYVGCHGKRGGCDSHLAAVSISGGLDLPDTFPIKAIAVHRARRNLDLERGIRETCLAGRRKASMRMTRVEVSFSSTRSHRVPAVLFRS